MTRTRLIPFSLASITGLMLAFASVASAQTLIHRYSFNDAPPSTTVADSVAGPSWNGTLVGSATLTGSELQLNGIDGWATLPSGVIAGNTQLSIEFWASFGTNNPFWTRTFAFGEQNGSGGQLTGLDYCHYAGGNWQNLNLSVTNVNVWANNPGGLNGASNVHVTIIVDPSGDRMFYYNGTAVASNPGVNGNGGNVPDLSGMTDTLNLIGKSLHDIDAPLEGSINEFRIYSGLITPQQLAINDAAGPNNYITDAGAIQNVSLTSPVNPLLVNQVSQQVFTGNFANVSGVNLILYGGATFTSGNNSILSVNPTNGQVTALSPGTTTVIASFGGQSATNTLTVITVPATLAHRYSFTADATDSVGGAHGTLLGTANVAGGKVVLDGSVGTYVDLPGNIININTNSSVTIEAWVDFGDVPLWSRLFNFGADGGSSELYFAPRGFGNGHNHWLSENFPGGRTIEWRGALRNLSVHLTCIVDPPSGTMAIYRDGVLEYARYDATASLSLVSSNLVVLGRSLVGVDPYLPGSIDEFRIYHGALTPPEIALAHQNGVGSTVRNPGTLNSIVVQAATYPAYSDVIAPVIRANYANLANFNLLPNNSASVNGLVISSSDTNVVQVVANNMIRTLRPGTATLSATYLGQSNSATITVKNVATLTHRYSFANDANDSVGTAHGTLQGTAVVTGGNLVLDGAAGSYLDLPPGLLEGYDAVTVDTWVTFNAAATWSRLWFFGDDRANELYVAPSVNGGSAHWYSTGFPLNGNTITLAPRWENETLHITSVYGNGVMEYYTNGVLHGMANGTRGRLDQVGNTFSWIGRSPHAVDPYVNANVNEFRIYRGRLAPDEIRAADVIGADQLLATNATMTTAMSGSNLILSWPVASAGFSVQSRTSLSAGSWQTLTNAPTLVGGNWQVTLPLSGSSQFFRLWR